MNAGDVLAGIAKVVEPNASATGLQGVSYPALNHVPSSPWAMVRQSIYRQTVYVKARAGLQVVRLGADVVLLVVSDEQRPGDAARLDGLVEPVLDLFDANAQGGNVNTAFAGILPESVDHIWHEAAVRRMAIPWGETAYCHAAIITLDVEFQRKAFLP